jgi:cellulose synthase (UDP-forming)
MLAFARTCAAIAATAGKTAWSSVWSGHARVNARVRRMLPALVVLAAGSYFWWRVSVVNPVHPIFSWFVFAAEAIGCVRVLMYVFSIVNLRKRDVPAAEAGLSVDLFVTTVDEPADLVRRTLTAAVAIRYPHETWLLDDGPRGEMRDLAREFGCRYVTRADRADGKAGNLNHALPLARAEFIALLDADQIADERFLDRTLGYFDDDGVAFVQTAQEFGNTDSFDHFSRKHPASHAQSAFNHLVQRSRDRANAAIFCGSTAVVRRAAIDAIGGFATGTVNEDTHTSMRLHNSGVHGVFHPEVLSVGLAPYDAYGYYGQRQRFAHGAVQLVARHALFNQPGMTRMQWQAYVFHFISNIEGWRYLAIYLLPIAILISGVLPLRTDGLAFALHFIPYAALAWFASNELARGHARIFETAVFNLARVPASIRATFTGHRDRVFLVTPKQRTARTRPLESAFPWLVACVSLTAIVFALLQFMAGRSPLSRDALIIVSAWAAFHVATAAALIAHTRRRAKNRRAATRTACDITATIARNDEPEHARSIRIIEATADGATLSWEPPAHAPPPGTYVARLESGTATFFCTLEVRGKAGAQRAGAALIWNTPTDRTAFDLHLQRRTLAWLAASVDADVPHGVEVAL